MARFNQWTQLLKASATSRRHDEKSDGVKQERYLLLDTAMGSENSGDHVIMDACGCIADQIFGGALPHVATHYYFQDFSPLAAQRPALNHPLRGWRQTALQSHPSDRY